MKKRILLTIGALLCVIAGFAGNIAADDITMKPGETKALSISLASSLSGIYGIQFEVSLPEGFSLEEGSNDQVYEISTNQVDDITCSELDLGGGSYRFIIYSSTLQELKGGNLMSLNLKADAAMALGNYAVTINNVALSDYDGNVAQEDGVSIGVKVTDFFTLLYIVDGEEYNSFEIEFGTSITPEAEPTKEGYTFSGWSEIPETMPANDVTVKGTFTIGTYKLTYMVDGGAYKTVTYDYGATVTPETEPTKEGYTFSGWSEIPETMPSEDVIVTGTFTINKYKLVYMVDGEEFKSYELDYGSSITPEAEPTKEGYTFSGWSEIPETMPAKDVTVTGAFTINKYKLVYMVDGAEYKSYEIEYGASITPEAEPTKEGHTFSGWSSIPETMPAKDVTVTGTFTKGAYKLTYMVDGEVYKTVTYDFDATITAEAVPTKEGYTFSGWSEIPETMPANDVIVTGTFTINKYKLVYMIDGAEYKSYEIEYGAYITPEAEPTKEGHTFSGWSSIPETMPAKDVTITGTFTKGAYKLTYMVDGTVYKTVTYDFDATITPEAVPTKEGYTFSGWSEIPSTMPAKDITVTGSFTINKYKLTYMVDGAEYKSSEIEYGAKITPEAEPTKEGYTFSGWSSIPETMPAKDVTVTGTFAKDAYKLTYMVDGEVYKTVTYDYGTTVTPEASPTKEGYTFSGWSEIPSTMPAKDVTVTGTFTINKYKLVYMVDGVEYKSYEIEYGASITPEAEPTKEGYTFSGWSGLPVTMPAKDVTVTGRFTKQSFKLIYMVDGEVYKMESYTYGSTILPEPNITKEGYTFSGWSEIPQTMPANDVTISGTFTINKYKLTYMIDGEVYKTYEIEYGAKITPEDAPQKEGYDFSGWDNVPETMPAYDVTVSASFSLGITSIEMNSEKVKIFDMRGNRLDNVRKGVNIIRTKDGKSKKVVVK